MYWLRAEMKPPAEGGAESGSAGNGESREVVGTGGTGFIGFMEFMEFKVFEICNELSGFGLFREF